LSVADDGAMTEFYERGDPPGAAAWAAFGGAVAAAASEARWVSFSGSMPPGVGPEEATRLVAAARAAGARVAVDQHGATLHAALRGGPDVVKVNVHEAREVTGAGAASDAARALADRQRAAGIERPVTVVTLGEQGALLLGPDEAVLRAGLGVRGPYPVGSGDAFLAGLLVAAPETTGGGDWSQALALALGAGAANAEVAGAASFDPRRARTLAAGVAEG
jgi:fructose-1-phosphate kinase PfkB-like protein